MTSLLSGLVALGAMLVTPAVRVLPAQDTAAVERPAVPFGVGERLVYDVKFGFVKVGTGSMEVLEEQPTRSRQTWHTVFRVQGGIPVFKVNDIFESWIDVQTLSSLRFVKLQEEGTKEREFHYEFFPERATYSENGEPEVPSVHEPLDEGSFLYFIRTIPLEVGRTYDFPRYYKPDRNPVTIRVLRKERGVKVPAGTFDTIVLQPIIKAKGIFSENGHAEVWLSDDDQRIMVQMKSSLSIGSISLYLKSRQPSQKTRP